MQGKLDTDRKDHRLAAASHASRSLAAVPAGAAVIGITSESGLTAIAQVAVTVGIAGNTLALTIGADQVGDGQPLGKGTGQGE